MASSAGTVFAVGLITAALSALALLAMALCVMFRFAKGRFAMGRPMGRFAGALFGLRLFAVAPIGASLVSARCEFNWGCIVLAAASVTVLWSPRCGGIPTSVGLLTAAQVVARRACNWGCAAPVAASVAVL
jgi:hypothetical protein